MSKIKYSMFILAPLFIISLLVSVSSHACDKPYEGTYALSKADGSKWMVGITVTVGEKTFVLSSGASGTVEATGDKLIFSGNSFTGAFNIEGNTLKNSEWTLIKAQ